MSATPGKSSGRLGLLAGAALLLPCLALGAASNEAKALLDAAGVSHGLVVHLDCGEGALTAALRVRDGILVHGLDTDGSNIRRARRHLREQGVCGPVSVARFDGRHLPYADNLVNLLVAENLGSVPREEAMRVLAPGGTLCVRSNGRWTRTRKPRPKDTDEWTHFLHDASGNAVAQDEVVGPPRRVQWIAKPRHTRSHEHIPSINAVVSAGGRIAYIADLAPINSIRAPADWHVVARDAYNGLLLWTRPFDAPWFPHIVNWGRTPRQLQRRLVAIGDRLYVTLGLHAPLSALDAATGETLKVYDHTRGTEESVYHKGTLLLAVRSVTDERKTELKKWTRLMRQDDSPVFNRDSAEPLVKRLRRTQNQAPTAIVALDAETGDVRWKHPRSKRWLRPSTLSALGNRVFYHKGGEIVCADLASGEVLWRRKAGPLRVVCEQGVACGGEKLSLLSLETGKPLWTQASLLVGIRDCFAINGSLWLGGFKPWQGKRKKHRGPAWGPYYATQRDLATGKVLQHIEPEGPGHHHRCWRNKATTRYILGGRRGVEFIDLKSGDYLWHNWVRGVCRYGVMPSNGLLYAPPHACGCYVAAKLTGFYALAHGTDEAVSARDPDEGRLERGPAYADAGDQAADAPSADDWPTYRHDAERSGATRSPVPAKLQRAWKAELGGALSSVTIAGGKVFAASRDEHTLYALDAGSGRVAWRFVAGGRIDSPPTIHGGRAIFGCRDGSVYSLRADDGALAWRLQAAGRDRRVVAWGQLESACPVPGSVLVRDGTAYVLAGRSSYLDGGLDLYRVRPKTGEVLSRSRIYSPVPETGRQPPQHGPCYMPGALGDVLTSDGQFLYLRDRVFGPRGRRREKGKPHLFALTGFLDDTWPHRSYWVFGTRCSIRTGCSGVDRHQVYGRLLAVDGSTVYGYGRSNVHWSNRLRDGAYRLFAAPRGEGGAKWAASVDVTVRALLLADHVLFGAGPAAQGTDGSDAGARLIAVSASDGSTLGQTSLDAPPVFDGMAAACGRLYLAATDGTVVCLAGER